jgi:hypothetical protein
MNGKPSLEGVLTILPRLRATPQPLAVRVATYISVPPYFPR